MPFRALRRSFVSTLASLGSSLFCIILPASCRLCHRPLRHAGRVPVCPACLEAVALLELPGCRQCGQYFAAVESSLDGRCLNCIAHPPAYSAALCATAYAGSAKELIHLLKFDGVESLAGFWAGRLLPLVGRLPMAPEMIVAVPLGRKHLAKRGYNQSAIVARQLARELGRHDQDCRFEPRAMRRVRETLPQSGLDAVARARNVAGAFRAERRYVAGRRVLLIDDVLTTGATASAAAKALCAAGAAEVALLTLARADLESARAVQLGEAVA